MLARVALVSCVKSKQGHAAPARELYTSALFTKARAWAEQHCDAWFVLSAKYGLVQPDEMIAPYELTLNTMASAERRVWARRVYGQMQTAGLLDPSTTFVWLAGAKYKADLATLLSVYPQQDPLVGLPLGKRLRWLS